MRDGFWLLAALLAAWAAGTPRATRADAAELDLARRQVQRAEAELALGLQRTLESKSPENAGRVLSLADEAQKALRSAVASYDAAQKLFRGEYEKLPVFVDADTPEGKNLKESKDERFAEYIQARFQAAVARFYLADSFRTIPMNASAGEAERTEWEASFARTCDEALAAFSDLHTEYRRQLVGLYAHLWVARSLAAKGDHRRALGIYEILSQHDNEALRPLQRQAFHFRLLSMEAQKEYSLIVAQAEPWLRENAAFGQEDAYPAVQLELARAYIELARQAPAAQARRSRLDDATRLLERLAKTTGPLAQQAQRQMQRVKALEEGAGRD